DRVDLIGEFTNPVSTTVIGRILGIPPKDDDERYFRRLAVQATALIRPFLSEDRRQRAERAAGEMADYIFRLVAERCTAARDDFISDLLAASDTASPGNAESITRVVAGLVSVGTGTTSLASGRALRTLFHHADHLRQLRDDRLLLPNAVEELLRYDSGIMLMP